jgi:hypothetical protein
LSVLDCGVAGQRKTRQSKTRQSKARQDKAKQDKTKQDKAKQDKTGFGRRVDSSMSKWGARGLTRPPGWLIGMGAETVYWAVTAWRAEGMISGWGWGMAFAWALWAVYMQ